MKNDTFPTIQGMVCDSVGTHLFPITLHFTGDLIEGSGVVLNTGNASYIEIGNHRIPIDLTFCSQAGDFSVTITLTSDVKISKTKLRKERKAAWNTLVDSAG